MPKMNKKSFDKKVNPMRNPNLGVNAKTLPGVFFTDTKKPSVVSMKNSNKNTRKK